jgi:hypothetical protein
MMAVTLRHHDHQALFEVHQKVQAAVESDMGQLQAQVLHVGKHVGCVHVCTAFVLDMLVSHHSMSHHAQQGACGYRWP